MKRVALLASLLCATAAHAANLPAAVAHDITDLGRAPADTQVSLAVTLAYRDQAGLDAFVHAVSTPGSPQYRHYLTADQFNARFAPSPEDYAAVVAAFQRAGLQVVRTYENRTVVDVAGSARAVEAYFGTESTASARPATARATRTSRPPPCRPSWPAPCAPYWAWTTSSGCAR